MSGYWPPSAAKLADLSGVFNLEGLTDGGTFVYDETTGTLAPGGSFVAGRRTVDAGQPDTSGDLTFRYGIDTAGCPYFDDAGAAVGEEAYVTFSPTDGVFYAEEIIP